MSQARGVAIKFQNVHKVYSTSGSEQPLHVLDDISFDIPAGSFCCLVGPSGCGKTTLLRLAGGLIDSSRGSVFLDGTKVTGPPRGASMVFQDSGLFPWMSVRDNVEAGIKMREHRRLTPPEREFSQEQIAKVGLAGFEDFYPVQLSGGMKQRVGLARALARGPRVMLMDEPFGALDAQTRALMQEELQQLWTREKITVLFVTHDLDEAAYLADTVVLMSRNPGRIKSVINVDVERPRTIGDPQLAEIRRAAWESLREELQGVGEPA